MTSNANSLVRTVDDMLFDVGQADAAELRAALLALGSLASLPVPVPGAELAALLSGQTPQLVRHRLLRKHRTAVVGVAVVAGMGLGITGVAASGPAPGAPASSSVQHLLRGWTPAWTITGTPAASRSADVPPEAQLPAEPASSDAALPVQPVTVEPETAAPEGSGPSRSPEPAGRGHAESPAWPKSGDGGTSGNAAGGTDGGAAIRDATTGDGTQPAGVETSAQLEQAGKLVAGTLTDAAAVGRSLTSTIVPQVLTEKTGTGSAGPGSIWLNKFSR